MFRLIKSITFLYCLLCTTISLSNSHEHLTYLPSADDLILTLAELKARTEGAERTFTQRNISEAVEYVLSDRGMIRNLFFRGSDLDPNMSSVTAERFGDDFQRILGQSMRENVSSDLLATQTRLNELKRLVYELRDSTDGSLAEARQELASLKTRYQQFQSIQRGLQRTPPQFPTNEIVRDELFERFAGNKSLGEMISTFPNQHTQETYLRSFLEFTSPRLENGRGTYLGISTLRANIFETLASQSERGSGDLFVRPFEHYANRTPPIARSHLDLSTPYHQNGEVLSGRAYIERLRGVREALSRGVVDAEINFQLSIPRRIFQESSALTQTLGHMAEYSTPDLRLGVDITGSITEDSLGVTSRSVSAESLKTSLVELLNSGVDIRIHAFEASNSGPFYDALYAAFSDVAEHGAPGTEINLRIGHISALTEADAIRLRDIRNIATRRGMTINLSFEANIESNRHVQRREMSRLLQTIRTLDSMDFRVSIGTDGAGILGVNEMEIYERVFQASLSETDDYTSVINGLIRNSEFSRNNWVDYARRRSVGGQSLNLGLCMLFDMETSNPCLELTELFSTSLNYCTP